MITAFELDDHIIKNMTQKRYVDGIINKPIQLEELSKKIEECLGWQLNFYVSENECKQNIKIH